MKIKILLITLILILIIFGLFAYHYLLRGTISISSNPSGANVYINGRFIGTTPCKTKALRGKYDVRISKIGFEEYSTTVDLKGGKNEIVSPNLEKLEYLLLVRQNKFYKMSSDGKIVKQLGESLAGNPTFISFSPDGKKILFEITSSTFKNSIWIMNTDGSNRKNLTGDLDVSGREFPLFSHTGEKIFFITSGSKKGYIAFWEIDIENERRKKIVEVKLEHEEIRYAISPDDSKILFYGYDVVQNRGPTSLWIVDSSGKNLKNLASEMSGQGEVTTASFSPNGNKVCFAFSGNLLGKKWNGLWVVDLDGKNMRRITKYREDENSPILSLKFSEDGKKVFFISDGCLWSAYIDGTGEEIVTPNVIDFLILHNPLPYDRSFQNKEKILLLTSQFSFDVINTDGTGETQISGSVLEESDSTFIEYYYAFGPPISISPDESHVLLTKAYTGEMYIVGLYTGKITKLNNFNLSCWFPNSVSN